METLLLKWLFVVKKGGKRKTLFVVVGCQDPEKYTAADLASSTPSFDTVRLLLAYYKKKLCIDYRL